MGELVEIMSAAGWSHDKGTGGFVKAGVGWVSWSQAEELLAASERGEAATVAPQSETINRITARVANV